MQARSVLGQGGRDHLCSVLYEYVDEPLWSMVPLLFRYWSCITGVPDRPHKAMAVEGS